MPTNVWMVGNEQRGCPISKTIMIPAALDDRGEPLGYDFYRNQATPVADEHLEFILSQTVMDKHNNPMHVFQLEPPAVELNDAERMRMQIEHQEDRINSLTALVASLVEDNPEMAAKLTMADAEDTSLLKGLDTEGD